MKNKNNIPTFLKWAGGKRRILETLAPFFPKKINNYFEPFLGGGSMFFFVRQNYSPASCIISDLNFDLIETYKAVRDKPEELIKELRKCKKKDSEDFYYETRTEFNQKKIQGISRSAAFIYMNKTCYSGLYRVNSKNEFNVPYGKYKHSEIFDEETIETASSLLKGVVIKHLDYREIFPEVSSGDFIYLDPCYDPIKKTSFVQYIPEKFTEKDRMELANFVARLDKKGANVLLSNNKIPGVKKLYPSFSVDYLSAPRSLGSRWASMKSTVRELAIHNY